MARRHSSYKFTEKTHSKRGIISTAISAVLLLIYGWFVFLAYEGQDTISQYHGSVGILAMMGALIALGLAVTTLKEEDSFQLFPRLSMITSVLAVVCWVGTYVLGFMS